MSEQDSGVGAAIVQVVEDAKAYAGAQVALYREIFAARLRAARTGLIFGTVAAVLILAALIALLLGFILSLAPLIGPLWATLVVVGLTLLVAAILGRLAIVRLADARGPIE